MANWKDVENEIEVGKRYWVCDYRLNLEGDFRPVRGIMPTYVEVRSNEELPSTKNIYYSNVHFVEINKKGELSKRIIAPFDNTGYRSYTGIGLNIFEKEEDCISFFNNQIEVAKDIFKDKILKIENHIQTLEDMKI